MRLIPSNPSSYLAWHTQAQYAEFAWEEVEAASGGEPGGGGMAGQTLNPICHPAWHLQAQYVMFAKEEMEAASGGEPGGGRHGRAGPKP